MKLNKWLLPGILILVTGISCVKYSFKGALPSYLKTIYIENFEDLTNYPGVWEDFMQQLNRAFISDNTLSITEDVKTADLILRGQIVSINRRPVSFTPQEQVEQFQMVTNVKVECMNTHTQKPLWSETISRYGIISGTAVRDEIDAAIQVAIEQIVDDIIAKTIGAW